VLVNISLNTRLGEIELQNPLVLASGIVGVTVSSLVRAIDSGAGGAVSKSIGLEPREGYKNPTLVGVDCGLLNAVGLANPGARVFSEELIRIKGKHLPIFVSIFGGGPKEFARIVEILDRHDFIGYELNLSCPHVEGVGIEIGHEPEIVAMVVKAVASKTSKPIFAKLSPNTHRINEVAKVAIDSGAKGLTAINTVRAMAIDSETQRPILTNKFGGLSGDAIRPIAVRCIYDLSHEFDVPIMGCGGVSKWEHAVELLLAGASAVQIGTALHQGYGIFNQIDRGIQEYMRRKRFRRLRDLIGISHKF
jgi:dihydroorotate dehydrogenase (NAD+) catalytic subunit